MLFDMVEAGVDRTVLQRKVDKKLQLYM